MIAKAGKRMGKKKETKAKILEYKDKHKDLRGIYD